MAFDCAAAAYAATSAERGEALDLSGLARILAIERFDGAVGSVFFVIFACAFDSPRRNQRDFRRHAAASSAIPYECRNGCNGAREKWEMAGDLPGLTWYGGKTYLRNAVTQVSPQKTCQRERFGSSGAVRTGDGRWRINRLSATPLHRPFDSPQCFQCADFDA